LSFALPRAVVPSPWLILPSLLMIGSSACSALKATVKAFFESRSLDALLHVHQRAHLLDVAARIHHRL
jgi:hypothetical protein